jgi:hypothetical protein
MSDKLPVLVVPHTHWDRAWYWPSARFRVRLVECLGMVLELCRRHPEYRFTCDGQALMVEDYLQARPQDRDELAALVGAGRVKLGPLWCQPDLYCTGGEALIRNLLIGRASARALGGTQDTLHLPDTFGITPSLPMIARGFGIATIAFMRGLAGQVPGMTSMSDLAAPIPRQVPEGTRLFRWHCPDGSTVNAFLLRDGYANAGGLGRDPASRSNDPGYVERVAVEQLIAAARRQDDAQGEPRLLLAGVDHQIPQPGLPSSLRAASAADRYDFRFADLDELGAVMARRDPSGWPSYQGEFHGSGAASVLGGTISARIHLKQRNADGERLLGDQVEPAAALARLAGIDEPAESALGLAWRDLLMNHPHDDICGCSVDAVHRDNDYRFDQVVAGGDALRRRLARRLSERFGGTAPSDERFTFLAFNAQPSTRREPWRIRLDFEARRSWGDYKLAERYAVVDEQGRSVPFRELSRGPSTEHPHETALLELYAALPPTTLTRFHIEPRRAVRAARPARRLENARLRADLAVDGTITLGDRSSKARWPGLGAFAEQADIGDSYDFADIPGERERIHRGGRAVLRDAGARDGVQAVTATRTLRVPEGAEGARRSRRRVALPTAVSFALGHDAPRLDCTLAFTATARDLRLRWCVPLPSVPTSTRAGLKFNEAVRPVAPAPGGTKPPRIHPDHPGDHFVAVECGGAGLAVFAEFPFNYEVVLGARPYLAVTVLRAVGWLTRNGLTTRAGGAGPPTPTPEAQCLGRSYSMRFALRPFRGDEAEGLFAEAARWRAQPFAAQIEGWWPQDAPKGHQGPFLSCDSPGVMLSALKPAHAGPGAVARLFNAGPREVLAEVTAHGCRELRPLTLGEEPAVDWACEVAGRGRWRVRLPPFALRTVALVGDSPWSP